MENTSGQGKSAAVPPEIDRWNWGAFFLNWIWGIANNTLIALLMFVPLVNLVMPFVLGAKGSAWAWRNKQWESIEQFKSVQRVWAIVGVVVCGAMAAFAVMFAAIFFAIILAFQHSEAYKFSVSAVVANAQVVQLTGKPMTIGFLPSGEINESGSKGSASLSFDVQGPNGKGTVYLKATKDMGQWKIDRMVLEEEGTKRRIDLVPNPASP
jgi:hypothetical protein